MDALTPHVHAIATAALRAEHHIALVHLESSDTGEYLTGSAVAFTLRDGTELEPVVGSALAETADHITTLAREITWQAADHGTCTGWRVVDAGTGYYEIEVAAAFRDARTAEDRRAHPHPAVRAGDLYDAKTLDAVATALPCRACAAAPGDSCEDPQRVAAAEAVLAIAAPAVAAKALRDVQAQLRVGWGDLPHLRYHGAIQMPRDDQPLTLRQPLATWLAELADRVTAAGATLP